MIIEGTTIGEIYLELIKHLMRGYTTQPRGMRTMEQIGVQLRLRNPRDNVIVSSVRNPNYRFMVTEWLWIFTGCDKVEPISRVNSKMLKYSDDGIILQGAYGPRFLAQAPTALKRLKEDPDSRRAVISFWRHDHDSHVDSKDVPCTLTIQFLIRYKQLWAIASMRSSDAWLGIPYDVFTFTMLQNYLAAELKVGLGMFILNLGSSHLYQEHVPDALSMLAPYEKIQTLRSARLSTLEVEHLIEISDAIEFSRLPDDEIYPNIPDVWRQYLNASLCATRKDSLNILKGIDHAYFKL